MTPSPGERSMRRIYLILILIMFAAFIMRLVNISYGLPQPGYFSSDEIDNVSKAVRFSLGTLKPTHLNKPTLYNVIIFVQYGVLFFALRIFGGIKDVHDFSRLFFIRPGIFYLLARFTSAAAGAFTVFLVYRIGRKIKDEKTGLISAFLLAFCFTSVCQSHIAKVDTVMVALLMGAIWAALRILKDQRWTNYALCGLLLGLSVSTKYNAVVGFWFLLAFHFYVHFQRGKGKFWNALVSGIKSGGLWIALAASYIGFCIGTPYFPLHPVQYISELSRTVIIKELGGKGTWLWAKSYHGFGFLARMYITELGAIFLVFFCLSVIFLKHKCTIVIASILALIFVYTVMLSVVGHLDYQYIMPLTPLICLVSALWITSLSERRKFLLVLVPVILIAEPFFRSIRFDTETLGEDTRISAARWIESNIPRDSLILFDTDFYYGYHPPLNFTDATYRRLEERAIAQGGTGLFFKYLRKFNNPKAPYDAYFLPPLPFLTHQQTRGMPVHGEEGKRKTGGTSGEIRITGDMDYYVKKGIRIVVTSGHLRKTAIAYKGKGIDEYKAFYAALDTAGTLVKYIKPRSFKNRGPTIRIYAFFKSALEKKGKR